MKLKFNVLILCISFIKMSDAQVRPSRLSFEINAGIPIAISSIPPGISTYGGIGLRYNITTALSLQTSFNIGMLRGSQSVLNIAFSERSQNYTKYHNTFYQYALRGQLNLERVFRLRAIMKKVNPYLTAGIGYTGTTGIEAERADGRLRKYDNIEFWTVQAGVAFRYYLNPTLDLNIGSELNLTQTAFLDGIPLDGRNDHFILTYVGINVKIGAKKKNQHIEWVNKVYRSKKPHKTKEDPEDLHSDQELTADEPDPVYADSLIAETPSARDSAAAAASLKDSELAGKAALEDAANNANVATGMPKGTAGAAKTGTTVAAGTVKGIKKGVKGAAATGAIRSGSLANKGTSVIMLASGSTKETRTGRTSINIKNKGAITANGEAGMNGRPGSTAPVVRINAPVDPKAPTLNIVENISKPLATYNVIVGAFGKSRNAYRFRNRLRNQGYQSAIFRSDINSQIMRVCIYSTNNQEIALKQLEKARAEVEPGAWIHVYRK
jgi:hypothetical protein